MTGLIVIVLIGLPLYTAFCLVRPTKPCRRCGGWGSKPGRRSRSARCQCRRCDGTGERFRVPARIAYRIRGAMRRHAELVSCPGLHCPGCSGGQSLGVASGVILGLVLLDAAVPWIADRVWWIGGTVAVCFALAVTAGTWLERLADRRGARFAAAHGILSRADVILPAPVRVRAVSAEPVRPAIAPAPQTIITGGTHIWLTGLPDEGQAAAIRRAIAGTAGDAITEGK